MNESSHREHRGDTEPTELNRLTDHVIGAAIEVRRHLKPGRPENTYKLALCQELNLRSIPHEKEVRVPITYKGVSVGEGYIDILVHKRLILELKAVEVLHEVHRAQLIGYLQAMDLQLGLLINFNVILLRQGIKRVINTYRNLRA